MANIRLGRRDILRGLGAGAVLLSPLVRSATAHAAGNTTPNLLVFFTPNGHVRQAFGAGGGSGFELLPSLAPLEPFKSKVSVLSGIDNPGQSSKHSHEDIVRLLTCVPGGDIYRGYGPSIDWVVAGASGQRPMTFSSRWAGAPNWQTKLSWKKDGIFDPHIDEPKAAYQDVFGSYTPTPGGNAGAEARAAQDRSVLDFIKADVATVSRRLGAEEKHKLDAHLEALRQIERNIQLGGGGAACSIDPLRQSIERGDAGANTADSLKRAIELKIDVMTLAFACGLRRAGTLLCQGGSSGLNMINGNGSHHDISHSGVFNLGNNADAREIWKQIDTWYASRFAYALERLSSLQILDNTVVVWVSEVVESHDQNGHVIPIAGGSALGLNHAKAYQGGVLSDVWVSVQKAMKVNSNTFGVKSSGGIPGLVA